MSDGKAPHSSIPARHVAAVVARNALEFYDFLTYAFFAIYIGRAFFPSNTPSASLLAALGTFGVGFVPRPVGSWVIGRMGDRAGRKPAMILTFPLMGAAIMGLALTPPRSSIGIAAPILVVFFRMLQGFALGGEVGPTTAFLLEAAPRSAADSIPPSRPGHSTSPTCFPDWWGTCSPARSASGNCRPTDGASRFCSARSSAPSACWCGAACRKPWASATARRRSGSPGAPTGGSPPSAWCCWEAAPSALDVAHQEDRQSPHARLVLDLAAVIGLAAMIAARETAPRKIAAPEARPAPVSRRSG